MPGVRVGGGRLKNSAQKEQMSNLARAAEEKRKTGDASRLYPLQKKISGQTWDDEVEVEA